MPEEITDVQAVESSATEPQDAMPAESSAAESLDAQAAESSTAEGDNELSPLDIVDKALGGEDPPASEDDGKAKPKESESKKVEDDLPDDPTEEELEDAAPRTQRRIEHLLGQRKDLRAEVENLQPQADQWAQIEKFREAQGMKPEHIANAMQIAALIENDPERAHEVVGKLHEMLSQKVGATLPDDLRESVKRGEITRERAFELSKAEAGNRVLEQRRTADAERREAQQQSERLNEQTRIAADTSTVWDKAKAVSDPDWNLKRDEVALRVGRRLKADGIPDTAEAMRKVLDEEAKALDALLGQFRPKGRTIQPTPSSASPRGAAPRVPKDHYDVVNIALDG